MHEIEKLNVKNLEQFTSVGHYLNLKNEIRFKLPKEYYT
jgi:hypothetical protein